MTHTRSDRRDQRKKDALARQEPGYTGRCSQREAGLRCVLYNGHVPSADTESGHCYDTANPQ